MSTYYRNDEDANEDAIVQSELERLLQKMLVNKFVATIGRSIEYGRWNYQYQSYRNKYAIHPTFEFGGPGINLWGDGQIVLGERSMINSHGSLGSSTGCKLVVGKNCAIGPYVLMSTTSASTDQDFSKSRMSAMANIMVGNDCWIGRGVFIRQGVSIGDDAVIGANSAVTNDMPPHCIAAGAPARVIRFKPDVDVTGILESAKKFWPSLHPRLKRRLLQTHSELKRLKSSHHFFGEKK